MFLNSQEVTEEIKKEIKKCLKTNDNENMTTQNLWDAAKAVLRGKFIVIKSCLKKKKRKRKALNRQPISTSEAAGKIRKTTTAKTKSQ